MAARAYHRESRPTAALRASIFALFAVAVLAAGAGRHLAWASPLTIQAGPAAGTPTALRITGRVVTPGASAFVPRRPTGESPASDNLGAFLVHDVEDAKVVVTVAGHRAETTSGDEGFFQVTLGKDRPLKPGTFVVTIEATRRHDRGHRTLYAQVVPAGPGLTVVSDFDDTVVVTGVRDLSTLVDNAFLKAPEAVTPVPRMASLYRCLAAGGDTPRVIQYITATPMNLQSRLMRVLAYRRFPRGPVVLKRLSLKTLGDLKGYKVHAILDLARRFPDHRFVLLGDDGQKDPEVYRAVQARLKGRVAAILIRQVPGVKVTPGRLAGMIPFHDGRDAAAALATRGLISRTCAQAVTVAAR